MTTKTVSLPQLLSTLLSTQDIVVGTTRARLYEGEVADFDYSSYRDHSVYLVTTSPQDVLYITITKVKE